MVAAVEIELVALFGPAEACLASWSNKHVVIQDSIVDDDAASPDLGDVHGVCVFDE